jgi:hypothetical protein
MENNQRRYTKDDMMRSLNVLILSGMLTAEISDDGEWIYKHSSKMSTTGLTMTFAQFMLEENYGPTE